jgi:two-component system response regulator HydG
LQEGEIYRIGGSEPIKVDVRIVCATNRNLETEVKKGRFREDLFYRINTIVLEVPPLRRRKEDIPILVDYFLSKGLKSFLPRELKISEEALSALMRYEWPGNVRELENVCERLQVLTEGHTIMIKDLPEHIRLNTSSKMAGLTYDASICLKELEKHWILKALEHHKGNKTQAALSLGVTIKTLYNKLHEYKMFHQFMSNTGTKLEVIDSSKV